MRDAGVQASDIPLPPWFLIETLQKSIDFERRAGSGAAGDRKVNAFYLKTFRKASILSAGPGRERPGIEKSIIFN